MNNMLVVVLIQYQFPGQNRMLCLFLNTNFNFSALFRSRGKPHPGLRKGLNPLASQATCHQNLCAVEFVGYQQSTHGGFIEYVS